MSKNLDFCVDFFKICDIFEKLVFFAIFGLFEPPLPPKSPPFLKILLSWWFCSDQLIGSYKSLKDYL